jgi:hypothetical protein
METALTFLIWALFAVVIVLGLLLAVHISALTDQVQANSEAIRADTKFRSK